MMQERAKDFVEAGRLAELVALTGDSRPALLFSLGGERLIWANLAGARFLNARSVDALLGLTFSPTSPIARRLPALAGLLANGVARTERITLPRGLLSSPVICKASRVILANGRGVLLQVADGSGVLPANALAAELEDFVAGAKALATAPIEEAAQDLVEADAAVVEEPEASVADVGVVNNDAAAGVAIATDAESALDPTVVESHEPEIEVAPVAFGDVGADEVVDSAIVQGAMEAEEATPVADEEPVAAIADETVIVAGDEPVTVIAGEPQSFVDGATIVAVDEDEAVAADSMETMPSDPVIEPADESAGDSAGGLDGNIVEADQTDADGASQDSFVVLNVVSDEVTEATGAPVEPIDETELAAEPLPNAEETVDAAPSDVLMEETALPVALYVDAGLLAADAVDEGDEGEDVAHSVASDEPLATEASETVEPAPAASVEDASGDTADVAPDSAVADFAGPDVVEAVVEAVAASDVEDIAPPATEFADASPTEDAPSAEPAPPAFVFPSHGRTVRFVFELDGDNRFGSASGELAETVGPEASAIAGEAWADVAARLGLDPGGRISAALERRDTFTGMTVDWPVSDHSMRVPIDLAGLPVFGRDRSYRGYRGFGVIKTGAAFEVSTPLSGLALVADVSSDETIDVAEPVVADAGPFAAVDVAEPLALAAVDEAVFGSSDAPAGGTDVAPAAVDLADDSDSDYTDSADLARLDGVDMEAVTEAGTADVDGDLNGIDVSAEETDEAVSVGDAAVAIVAASGAAVLMTDAADAPTDVVTDDEASFDAEIAADEALALENTSVEAESDAGAAAEVVAEITEADADLEDLAVLDGADAERIADEVAEDDALAFAAPETSDEAEGTVDDGASEAAYAEEMLVELSDAGADELGSQAEQPIETAEGQDAEAVADLGDDEANFAPSMDEPDAHLVAHVASLVGDEEALEAGESVEPVATDAATMPENAAVEIEENPADELLTDDESSLIETDEPILNTELAAEIAEATGNADESDGNEPPEELLEAEAADTEHLAESTGTNVVEAIATDEEEPAGPVMDIVSGDVAPSDPVAPETAETETLNVSEGAEIIASPIIPRLHPREVLSADEEARRQLSKPEREAFNKIAEALGARIDGDAAAPVVAESDVPAFGLVGDPAATPTEAADAAIPAVVGGLDRSVLDRLPISIALLKDGEAVYMNKSLLALAGYPDFATFQDEGGFASIFAGSALPRDASLPAIRRRDGVEVPVSAQLHRIPLEGGSASLMVLQDLASATGRARANDAEQRVDELEAILDTATDGVLILDQRGAIIGANQSAEALFGRDKAAMIGEALVSLLAPESHRAALDYLDGLGRNGLSSVLNDGREVIGRAEPSGLVPLFMTVGRVGTQKFCAVLRDITQWKRAEEELTNAKRSAENASSQKSDFLAKISHEIRTPLNAIIGFSEVMMEERFGPVGSERYKEYLRDIHLSGAHIMSLVNDLLDLSKIEAGKLELAFEAVDANDIIRECVALMQPQANRERIIIRNSLSSSLPNIVADNRSLRQIILNLLSNAIKFNTTGGQVIISTLYEDTGEVAIRVRDTGPGMSEDEISKAMEPFRQLHTTRPGRGTGLGLPLTKALVEANRAGFRIDSAPGQGTLVQITFPSTRVLAE